MAFRRSPTIPKSAFSGVGHYFYGWRMVGCDGKHKHVHLRDCASFHHDGARGELDLAVGVDYETQQPGILQFCASLITTGAERNA